MSDLGAIQEWSPIEGWPPVACLGCGATTLFDVGQQSGWTGDVWETVNGKLVKVAGCRPCNAGLPVGWIVETWETVGGGIMKIVICFACRNLVGEAFDEIINGLAEMVGAQR